MLPGARTAKHRSERSEAAEGSRRERSSTRADRFWPVGKGSHRTEGLKHGVIPYERPKFALGQRTVAFFQFFIGKCCTRQWSPVAFRDWTIVCAGGSCQVSTLMLCFFGDLDAIPSIVNS